VDIKKENLKEKMGFDYDDGEWSRHSKNSFFFFGTKGNITLDHAYICLSFKVILVSIVSQDQIS
jgi:hypothetical protein